MRRAARPGRGAVVSVVGVTALVVGIAAAPVGAAAKPDACRVVTPAAVAAATGQPIPPTGDRVRLDRGRGSQCEYKLNGGYVHGGSNGADLNVSWSPVRAGRSFLAGTSRNMASDSGRLHVVPQGPGDLARLGGERGFRQLLVFDGPRTLLLDVQVPKDGPVTDATLESWLLALARGALGA